MLRHDRDAGRHSYATQRADSEATNDPRRATSTAIAGMTQSRTKHQLHAKMQRDQNAGHCGRQRKFNDNHAVDGCRQQYDDSADRGLHTTKPCELPPTHRSASTIGVARTANAAIIIPET